MFKSSIPPPVLFDVRQTFKTVKLGLLRDDINYNCHKNFAAETLQNSADELSQVSHCISAINKSIRKVLEK